MSKYQAPVAVCRAMAVCATPESDVDSIFLDPDMILYVDTMINKKIFIIDDNIYFRDDLYRHYGFPELNVQPEMYFEQYILGLFPDNKLIASLKNDQNEFYSVHDMLKKLKDLIHHLIQMNLN